MSLPLRLPEASENHSPAPESAAFGAALLFWLKLGFISFGGPAGQIALMHRELVERRRWISERRFLHALNYCMLLPGPEAQQLATYLGWLLHRTWGGVAAGVLFVLPSLFILVGLSWVYVAWGHLALVAGVLAGIKPTVAAIVLQAAHRLGQRTLSNGWLWGIALASFLAIQVAQVPFPAIVAGAALLGWAGGRWRPHVFSPARSRTAAAASGAAALIDDHTPTPAHAHFRWSRLAWVLGSCAALWVLPMGMLTGLLGWNHTLTQMSWFFTKAALLTFGGAYAVLPYVVQGAVLQFGWLTATQMMDGLALGETTPGPLIMVVAFVGFMGGYGRAVFGPDALFLAGAVAAALVTWFTFLPSFMFILAGGPLVESSRHALRFTAPLVAITAAVVGVMASLALYFLQHVLWPHGFAGGGDVQAALMTLGAAVALFHFRLGVMQVIAASAALGALLQMAA
jgi:chromate transporter